MRALKAFTFGALAGAVIAYAAAATTALALSVAGAELSLAAGPIVAVTVERTGDGIETTFGAGLLLVPVLCGLANAAAAALLAARGGGDPMA